MLDLSIVSADTTKRLISCSPYAEDVIVRCNEHGYESLTARVPMEFGRAMNVFQATADVNVYLTDGTLWPLFQGRLEDKGVYSDDTGSGLSLTAYGRQNAYRDVPYSALWSATDTSEWRAVLETEQAGWSPQRYEIDTSNRIFISPRKGDTHGGAVGARNIGGVAYHVPDRSERVITRISFDYTTVFPSTDWILQIGWYSAAPTGASWTSISNATVIVGSGSGTITQTLTGSPVAVEIRIFPSFNPGVALTQETNTQYARITNLRVTTATPTIHGGTIASALVDFVASVNASHVSTSKEYIQSPGYDLKDEVYEDMYPADILDKLAALGDTQVPPRLWQWSVWEGKRLRFEPRGTGGRTWYVNAGSLELNRTYSQLLNSAYAVYRSPSGETLRTATSTDTASVSAYGVTRRQAVSTDTANSAQATVTRDAVVLDGKTPKPQVGISFTALHSEYGARVPVYFARPGDTIKIRNLPPVLTPDRATSFRIIATEYRDGIMSVTPESPIPTLDTLLARREEKI